jgi:Lipocalin-like domain
VSTMHGREALVGAWQLLSWENRPADGRVTYPMGTDALGYLLYTASGRFSVTISRRGRAGFAAGDLLSGTTEEQARAVEGFVAYAGRYSFMQTGWCIMWSCRCSPTGSGPTSSGWSSWPGIG